MLHYDDTSFFDTEVRVFFADENYQMSENNGSVSVCVEREGDAAESFSVEVATAESNPVQAEGIMVILWVSMLYFTITFSWQ